MKKLLAALAGAMVAGVAIGAVSRLLMRVITVVAAADAAFSASGTIFIVLAYAMFMAPGALLAAFTTRRWRWVLLAAGALALCLPAVSIASEEIGATGYTALQWVGVGAASAGLFALIAALPVTTLRVVDRLLRSPA